MKKKVKIFIILVTFFTALIFIFSKAKKSFLKKNSPKEAIKNKNSISKEVKLLFEEKIDFENIDGQEVQSNKAVSGKKSQHFSAKLEYGYNVARKVSEILKYGSWQKLNYSVQLNSSEPPKDALVVCSIENSDGKSVKWMSQPIEFKAKTFEKNKWNKFETSFDIDDSAGQPQLISKVYIWNRGKSEFDIDDIAAKYLGIPNESGPHENQAQNSSSNLRSKYNMEFDFETPGMIENAVIVDDVARSGKHSYKLSSSTEYGAGIKKQIKDIINEPLNEIFVSVWIYPEEETDELMLVATIDSPDGKTKIWQGKSCKGFRFKKHQWQLMNARLDITEAKATPDDYFNFYPWNKTKSNLYLDDLTIVFGRHHCP